MKKEQIKSNPTLAKARRLFENWNKALETGNPQVVADLYTDDCTFLPTMSPEFKKGKEGAKEYFDHFLLKDPKGQIVEDSAQSLGKGCICHSGLYNFEVGPQDVREIVRARFTFVWNSKGEIVHHHSSLLPKE